jgi:hypothetical protein
MRDAQKTMMPRGSEKTKVIFLEPYAAMVTLAGARHRPVALGHRRGFSEYRHTG